MSRHAVRPKARLCGRTFPSIKSRISLGIATTHVCKFCLSVSAKRFPHVGIHYCRARGGTKRRPLFASMGTYIHRKRRHASGRLRTRAPRQDLTSASGSCEAVVLLCRGAYIMTNARLYTYNTQCTGGTLRRVRQVAKANNVAEVVPRSRSDG